MQSQTLMHLTHGAQCLHRLLLLCRDGQRQAVDHDILAVEPIGLRLCHNAFGNSNALRRCFGQTALIHREPEYCRPIVFRKREDRVHACALPTDRVDDGAPVRHAQCRLDHCRIRRVDLQRQINNALDGLDYLRDDRSLIDALCTDIDVEHLRARLLLCNGEFLDVAHILLKKRLLQPLLARRIDALSDDIDLAILCDASGRSEPLAFLPCGTVCCPTRHRLREAADKVRIGAAAAAENECPALGKVQHLRPEHLRRHLVGTRARVGETCIRLDDDRQVRPLHHLCDDGAKLRRTERAVDTECSDAERIQRHGHGGHRSTEEGAAVLLEGHRHPDGQLRMFLRCKHGCLYLIEIRQRLKDDEVGTCRLACRDHLAKEFIRLLKGECSQRLNKFADRTDIEGDAYTFYAGMLRRTACRRDICRDHLGNALPRTDQLMSIGTERIAVDHAAARRNIVAVHLFNHIGMLHPEEFGALPRGKAARLQLRAHTSVQNNNIVHFPIYSHLFPRLCPFAAPAPRLTERAGTEHETVLTVRWAVRLRCARNPHDRRHGFARHHDRRRRQ